MITPSLEKVILHFATYSSIIGRKGYGDASRDAIKLSEPEKTNQLDILKSSIIEIFNVSSSSLEFNEFANKYNLSASEITEFLKFLGDEDFGLDYFGRKDIKDFVTVPTYLKNKLEEKLFDEVSLFLKLNFGIKFWEEYEYKEADTEIVDDLIFSIYKKSPTLGAYIQNSINLIQ